MQAVAEQAVRTLDRAWLELFHTAALRELREADATEEGGAEHRHVERQVRLGIRLLGGAAGEAPAPFVPRTERITYVEHELAVLRVGAAGECRADVDEAHPQ